MGSVLVNSMTDYKKFEKVANLPIQAKGGFSYADVCYKNDYRFALVFNGTVQFYFGDAFDFGGSVRDVASIGFFIARR